MDDKKEAMTSVDIARLAGVSQATVSRAFTPGSGISKKKRALVLSVAARAGYRPNAIARTLRTRQSRLIGIVATSLGNPFYDLAIQRFSMLFQEHAFRVLLFTSDLSNADELLIDSLQYQVQGVVLLSATLSSPLAEMCEQSGVPVVLVNRVSKYGSINSIASANYSGGRLAAETLLRAGHQRIAFVAGHEDTSTSQERERGLMSVLGEHGVQLYARAVGNFEFEQTRREIVTMMRNNPAIDAIFAANDYMAIATIDALRKDLSLRVPEDVSVIGFDNIPAAAWGGYQLTTIEQPLEMMIQRTVDVLLDRMKHGVMEPQQITLPVRLIVRGSVKNLPDERSGQRTPE